MNSTTMLTFDSVKKVYTRGSEQVHALEDITLTINKGEYVVIMGPSGSGKTTFLNIAGCLDTPTSGTVKVNNEDVSNSKEKKLVSIRKKYFGFVFQQFFLIPTLTVLENILLPTIFTDTKSNQSRGNELLELVGLGKRMNHRPSQLSGGEMQRVAIARSLINAPSILLADEPTGNLDSKNAHHIMEIFGTLNKNGLTIIMVTHNPELVKKGTRIIGIEDGTIKH